MPLAFTTAESFDCPPRAVFHALTAIESWHEWMPGLVAVEKRTPGPFGVGTIWRETRRIMKREATEEFEVLVCDPPRRLELRMDGTRGTTGRGEFLFEYHLAPSPTGTEVVLHGEIRLGSALAELVGRLFVPMMRRGIARDLEALARHLSSRSG